MNSEEYLEKSTDLRNRISDLEDELETLTKDYFKSFNVSCGDYVRINRDSDTIEGYVLDLEEKLSPGCLGIYMVIGSTLTTPEYEGVSICDVQPEDFEIIKKKS